MDRELHGFDRRKKGGAIHLPAVGSGMIRFTGKMKNHNRSEAEMATGKSHG
jgi:hypothetical protein